MLNCPNYFLILSNCFCFNSTPTNGIRIVTAVLSHGNLVSRQARSDGATRFRIVHMLLLEVTTVDWRVSEERRGKSWKGRLELRGFHADGSEQYHVMIVGLFLRIYRTWLTFFIVYWHVSYFRVWIQMYDFFMIALLVLT